MAERRLHFITQDASGAECRGDILITTAWHSDIALDTHAAFTIVLTRQPVAGTPGPVPAGVAVCVPASPIRLPVSVREPRAPYGTTSTEVEELRLPRSVVSSYAGGAILGAGDLLVKASEVFLNGITAPRFDALARALIDRTQRAERYWRTLAEALARPQPAPPRTDAEAIQEQLRSLVANLPQPCNLDAAGRLREIAEGVPPQTLGSDPAALADDVARLHSLQELPAEAGRLGRMRDYLSGVRFSDGSVLAQDYPYTKEQLSFVALRDQPHLIDGMRATFETFRSRYSQAYVAHHAQYWQAVSTLQQTLHDAEPTARAIVRLNSLKRLGSPVGLRSLRDFERFRNEPSACSEADVEGSIREQPLCSTCSISLRDDVPKETLTTTIQELERALAEQRTRLASAAVHRILARGGERLDQFLQVVQASDLVGLVSVLDDDLVSFLDDLLTEPTATAAE